MLSSKSTQSLQKQVIYDTYLHESLFFLSLQYMSVSKNSKEAIVFFATLCLGFIFMAWSFLHLNYLFLITYQVISEASLGMLL